MARRIPIFDADALPAKTRMQDCADCGRECFAASEWAARRDLIRSGAARVPRLIGGPVGGRPHCEPCRRRLLRVGAAAARLAASRAGAG